jgi:hypothetical protein
MYSSSRTNDRRMQAWYNAGSMVPKSYAASGFFNNCDNDRYTLWRTSTLDPSVDRSWSSTYIHLWRYRTGMADHNSHRILHVPCTEKRCHFVGGSSCVFVIDTVQALISAEADVIAGPLYRLTLPPSPVYSSSPHNHLISLNAKTVPRATCHIALSTGYPGEAFPYLNLHSLNL